MAQAFDELDVGPSKHTASPILDEADQPIDHALRPRRFEHYVGQDLIKKNLLVAIEAARVRSEPLEHVLLAGPPGLGKTTLALLIGNTLEAPIRFSSGPALARTGDLAALLSTLEPNDLLFIDEIHRLPRVVEEMLYPVMEDFRMDLVVGKGPGARSLRLEIPPFTLVGATTRSGALSSPMRDRFGHQYRLDYYTSDEIARILKRSAKLLKVTLHEDALQEIARRSRGVPRIANRLLKRVRDLAQVRRIDSIMPPLVEEALTMLDIDQEGLDAMDRKILHAMLRQFNGGPVGIEALAAALGEEKETLEDVYEPFLLQRGLLARTPRGRVVTKAGTTHLGAQPQGKLI